MFNYIFSRGESMEDEDIKKIEIIDEADDNIGDENVYSETGRERLVEDEEMSMVEDAFMQGYESAYE
jgi:hypothetical protein